MTQESFDSTCLRHPEVASNLRCGRCGDLICPQCMVQSPVGARCPDCANIGQAPIFRSTNTEMTTVIASAAAVAVGVGVVYALIVWVLWNLPFNFAFGNVFAAMIVAIAGTPVGELIRRVGRYKLDTRLRYIAAGTMFVTWAVGITVAGILGVPAAVFSNIVALIGLGIGIYIAMNRVRP